MFEWTKENILNKVVFSGADAADKKDNVIVSSLVNPVTGDEAKRLLVKRDGEYFNDRVCGKIFRTVGYAGEVSKMTIDCDGIVIAGKEVPQLLQATIKIKMFNKFLGEYANANWALFGKPILVGFEIPETAEDADVAECLAEALKLAVPEDNKFMSVELDGSKVILELADEYACFESFALESYDPTACDSCLGEYVRVALEDGKVEIVKNVEPFATGAWIRENLRFPSYPNMRYAPLYADEQPVPDALYVMYSFDYRVEGLPAGLNWAGEKAASETRHVFYVLASEDAKFKEALEAWKSDETEICDDHFHKDENEDPMHKNPSEEPQA